MSEREPTRAIVLAHGTLAEGLVDAVHRIAGPDEGALTALSNRGLSAEGLAAEIRSRIGDGPAFLFTDLPSGSCSFAARWVCRDCPDLYIISGVNLPLLLEFVLHRQLPPAELIPRLLAKGRAAIGCAPTEPEGHGSRAVSGG